MALTLILAAGGAAPANGQHRGEAPPAVTAASDPVDAALKEASSRFVIPRDWIAGVLQAESGGNVHAVSAKGALGLMQVMPQTWQQLRLTLHLGDDAFDRTTYPCGDRYLRQMLDRYGTSGFLAAYNAGPVRYDDHLATGKPLPNETQTYMARLASALHLPQPGSGPSLALDPRLLMFVGTSGTAASTPASQTIRNPASPATHQAFALAPQSQGLFVAESATRAAP